MSTVYVIQEQMRFDRTRNVLVPRFKSLQSASSFGQIEYLLSPSASPFDPESIILELRNKLALFCDDDHLLLIGNPILIGMASTVAAQANGGRVKFLQWSGKDQRYLMVASRMF